ncbi:MAG: stage V sporulation protein AC [Clostridia bacterium]|nr:stage V sporulation protein AC [Clostridia bacterium]
MKMSKKEYGKMAEKTAEKSPLLKDCIKAFVIGGAICAVGEVFLEIYKELGSTFDMAAAFTSVTLIGISALLTGLGLYDKIAKHAGAGTLVPITGFANSIVASALEFKSEGFILGMCAKMFAIAGPVIVYGTTASFVYGIIYWFMLML